MPDTPETWLNEFQVNTTLSGLQARPDITQLENGNLLVVWESDALTGVASAPGRDLVGRIYSPLGPALGGEFLVNSTVNSGGEQVAAVAALPDGGFLTVFQQVSGAFFDIELSEHNANGSLRNTVTAFADPNSGAAPEAASPQVAVSAATALVVWQETEAGGDLRIVGRIYNPATNNFGAVQPLIDLPGNNFLPDVTALSNGNYVVVGVSGDLGNTSIQMRIVNPVGANVLATTALPFTVNNAVPDTQPTVTALANGGYVVAWANIEGDDSDVYVQVFENTGIARTGPVLVTGAGDTDRAEMPQVQALEDGSFVVVYDEDALGQLRIEHFNARGVQLGEPFDISAGVAVSSPSVTSLADGRIAVTFVRQNGEIGMELLDTRDNANAVPGAGYQVGTVGNDSFLVGVGAQVVSGHFGDDIIRVAANQVDPASFFNGGAGTDSLRLTDSAAGTWNFIGETVAGFERLTFESSGSFARTAVFTSAQFAQFAAVDFDADVASAETLVIELQNAPVFDLTDTTFTGFGSNDRIEVRGSALNEAITGSALNDSVTGAAGNDLLLGGQGDDTVDGGSGNDTLDGGAGNDVMRGGLGLDRFTLADAGDRIVEEQSLVGGFDTVVSFTQTINLANIAQFTGRIEAASIFGDAAINVVGNLVANILTGNDAGNVINGLAGADNMRGRGGNDTYVVDNAGDVVDESLAGSFGNDRILSSVTVSMSNTAQVRGAVERLELQGSANINGTGNLLQNAIFGNAGNNSLNGLGGNDILTGGAGADNFVFSTAPVAGNVDVITDFNSAEDRIWLDDAVFGALSSGTLVASQFRTVGTGPQDADDYIVYNPTNGAIYYDPNGNVPGGGTLFAFVTPGLALTAEDFLVY